MERKYNVILVSDDGEINFNGITHRDLDFILSITDNQEDLTVVVELNHDNQRGGE